MDRHAMVLVHGSVCPRKVLLRAAPSLPQICIVPETTVLWQLPCAANMSGTTCAQGDAEVFTRGAGSGWRLSNAAEYSMLLC